MQSVLDRQNFDLPDIFYGDDFENCLSQSEGSVFCSITAKLSPKNLTNPSEIWEKIEKLSSDPKKYRYDLLRHGVCVPKQCWNYHETISTCLERIYNKKYENLGLGSRIVDLHCQTKKSEYPIGTLENIFIKIVAVYLVFVLLVSIWLKIEKYTKRHKNIDDGSHRKSPIKKFLSIFSAFDFMAYILSDKSTTKKNDHFYFLEGMRFVVSFGTILFHVSFTLWGTPNSNPTFVEELLQSFPAMVIATGGMAVQAFFVMSSWLLAVSFFKKLQKSGKIEFGFIVRLIIKRYLRITPAYALVVFFHSTWVVHLKKGPFWDSGAGEEYRACRQYWWRNLLYINNFDYGTDRTCLLHTWYLSADLQFTILALLMLWMTQKKPKRIFFISGFIIIFQIVHMFFTLLSNHFEMAYACKPEDCQYVQYLNTKELQATWTSIYSNLAGLAVGLTFGYLYAYHDGNIFTKQYQRILWYFFAWILTLGVMFFASYYMTTEYYHNNTWFAATYGSVHQVLFVFGVGLQVLGMSQGLGGVAKNFFESRFCHTLGQLSFGAYLIHYTFVRVNAASRQSPHFVSFSFWFYDLIVAVILSYSSSLILTAFVIMPLGILLTVWL